MARYAKVVAGISVVAGALGFTAFNSTFDVAPEPEVTNEIIAPKFSYHCMEAHGVQPLDHDGQLTVSVWNIYKQQRPNWQQALDNISQHSELVLLQEATLKPELKQYLQDKPWKVRMANAFRFLDTPAGVMNLSKVEAMKTCAYLAMEPWLRLPKSALLSQFALSNGQTLAVVNLHGVNFAMGLEEYKAQFKSLASALQKHVGPVILAGDFNTWRKGRMDVVKQFAHQLGLKEVQFRQDQRIKVFGKPLDHLFYRGLVLETAEALKTDASDHNPIIATFRLRSATTTH
ncbi:endonuclease/exonuclease/phosphatase family protein [Photobacterium damselae]|nr:endonuclease/exonuclease/phosphatase family protein [Photobacterium damselae]